MTIEPTAFRAEQVTTEGLALRSAGASYSDWVYGNKSEAWMGEPAGMSGIRNGLFGDSIETLLNDTLTCEGIGLELLLALQAHVSALNCVWEAHQRGAAVLPESVAHSVSVARTQVPRFLSGVKAGGQ